MRPCVVAVAGADSPHIIGTRPGALTDMLYYVVTSHS